MAHDELKASLDLLRQSRERLILRTTSQNADLFSNLFLFEKNEMGLKLTFEKEITQFINSHFSTSDEYVCLLSHSTVYALALKRLIYSLSKEEDVRHAEISISAFYRDLNLTKVEFLDLLINLEKKSEVNFSQFKYVMIRDDRIFDREIEKLTAASKGN